MLPVETYLQRIAQQNHMVLSRDDPILILLTIFEQYEEELKTVGETERHKLVAALELEQDKWTAETERRAERLMNAGIKAVEEEAQSTFKIVGDNLIQRLDMAMRSRLATIEQTERRITLLGIAITVCSAVVATSFLLFLLFQ